jgi:hypothetical protein
MCRQRSCCMRLLPPDSTAPARRVCMWLYHRRRRLYRLCTYHMWSSLLCRAHTLKHKLRNCSGRRCLF